MKKVKGINLIELMVVIIVLSILALLAIMNIKSIKLQAISSVVAEDTTTTQTATNRYDADNGSSPTDIQPTTDSPQPINWNDVIPKYLRAIPKSLEDKNVSIDVNGKILIGETKTEAKVISPYLKTFGDDTYDGESMGYTWAESIAKTPNDNVLVLWITVDSSDTILGGQSSQNQRLQLTKFDTEGNVLWNKPITIEGSSDSQPGTVNIDSEDNILITGSVYSGTTTIMGLPFNNTATQPFLLKLNSNGEPLWVIDYSTNATSAQCPSSLATIGTDIYAIPRDNMYNSNTLVKIDKNGNKSNFKTFDADHVYGIIPTADGNLFTTIKKSSETLFRTIKMDKNGNELWNITQALNSGENIAINKIINAKDGDYILAGEKWGSSYDNPWIAKINQDGSKQWEKRCGGSSFGYFWSAAVNNDGNIAIAGYKGDNNGDAYIVQLSPDGALLKEASYSGSDYDEAYDIVALSDSGYAIVGEADSVNNYYSNRGSSLSWGSCFLIKTDKDMNISK